MVSDLWRIWNEDMEKAAERAARRAAQKAAKRAAAGAMRKRGDEGRQEEQMRLIRSMSAAGLSLKPALKTAETLLEEIKRRPL